MKKACCERMEVRIELSLEVSATVAEEFVRKKSAYPFISSSPIPISIGTVDGFIILEGVSRREIDRGSITTALLDSLRKLEMLIGFPLRSLMLLVLLRLWAEYEEDMDVVAGFISGRAHRVRSIMVNAFG